MHGVSFIHRLFLNFGYIYRTSHLLERVNRSLCLAYIQSGGSDPEVLAHLLNLQAAVSRNEAFSSISGLKCYGSGAREPAAGGAHP